MTPRHLGVLACLITLFLAGAMSFPRPGDMTQQRDPDTSPVASALVPTAPFSIEGDDGIDVYFSGHGTNGTDSDPHVIRGLHVDASSSMYGIMLVNTTKHLIIEGNLLENNQGNPFATAGVFIINSSNIIVRNNTFIENNNGVGLAGSANCSIYNNTFIDCVISGIGIGDSRDSSIKENAFHNCGMLILNGTVNDLVTLDIDTSNTINTEGTIYYIKNHAGPVLHPIANGSQVAFINCSDIHIRDFHTGSTTVGIGMMYSTNITIEHGHFDTFPSWGIVARYSNHITLLNNSISGALYGVGIADTVNLHMEQNNIFNNTWDGIVIANGNNSTIVKNSFHDNHHYNVKVVESNNTRLTRNDIWASQVGIGIAWNNVNVSITGNFIFNCSSFGIEVAFSSSIQIIGNDFHNNQIGLRLTEEVASAKTCLNNFIDSQTSHVHVSTTITDWNCTLLGNYWDDFIVRHPDAVPSGHGTWLTPYEITVGESQHVDHHPLVQAEPLADTRPSGAIIANVTHARVSMPVLLQFNGTTGNRPATTNWMVNNVLVHAGSTSFVYHFNETGTFNVSIHVIDVDGDSFHASLPVQAGTVPNATVLSIITTSPATMSSISVAWNTIPGAVNYTVYRYSQEMLIPDLDLATVVAITVNTSIVDHVPSSGTWWYVVIATNVFGDSDMSNAEAILVDLSTGSDPAEPPIQGPIPWLLLIAGGIGIASIVLRKRAGMS